ncbi:MAG: ATP-dependent helicase [Spirochaetes bacterium]|nr:ATP-dependent helicase [Spirochaetota bacterium]
MTNIKLSVKQQEIVSFESGAILVKASAGSGKTRVLTERIKRLLNVTNRNILAITFTNKAGEEMKERLGNINDIKDRLFIGTFHGFCQQVLENHGQLIGYTNIPHIFEDESDRLKLIEQAIQQTPSYHKSYENQDPKRKKEYCYRALNFISEVKRKLIPEDDLLNESDDEDLVLLYTTYQDILNSQNAIDFDDLILLTYNLFITNPKTAALYRRTYEYICVDEAQDLNYAQYQLIRSITSSEHQNVMMVGDPNQSIFAFNGSSSEYMIKMFVEDFNPIIIELKENYRSSRSVLLAAEKIIPDFCDIVNAVIEGIFEIHKSDDEESESIWISDKINELISIGQHDDIEGDITYEKIAVLGRNKYVFKSLTEIFEKRGVPYYYKITPGTIKFESQLMKIFDMTFRVKLNPQDTLHWYRLLELCSNTTAKNLQELTGCLNDKFYKEKEVLNTIINLSEDGSNFKLSLNKLLSFIEDDNNIEDHNEKIMILNDIKELLEHWYEYAKRNDKKSLQQFKNSMALGKTHPLAQKNGITLSTIHTMKGQEYDIVFLMGMDDDTFPDYRAIRMGGAEMVQEKNNAYVAFTRSKRFLYVTWPAKRLMPWGDYKYRKISRFLLNFNY